MLILRKSAKSPPCAYVLILDLELWIERGGLQRLVEKTSLVQFTTRLGMAPHTIVRAKDVPI